jgi:hypothetical protein
MHVVLGAGNLGCSLTEELMVKGIPVTLFSTAVNDWKYPKPLTRIFELNPSHIWMCVGSDHLSKVSSYDITMRLPLELIEYSDDKAHLHFFSYLDPLTHSQYCVKRSAETIFPDMHKTNPSKKVSVHWLSHIYGTYKPKKCLPYQISKDLFKLENVEYPRPIIPTPTDWIAKTLIDEHLDYNSNNWSNIITPSGDIEIRAFYEQIRDQKSNLWLGTKKQPTKTKTKPSWLELWLERNSFWKELHHAGNHHGQ